MLLRRLYGHELDDWPRFRWDAQQIAYPLGEVRHRQGLDGDSGDCPHQTGSSS
ncbi:MAG: DUF4172 domain-containing protein [Deltaproteobacteria bacterium]|nr:DUF4172 domain-containing protein [Deltaproteobacteria bacterium]